MSGKKQRPLAALAITLALANSATLISLAIAMRVVANSTTQTLLAQSSNNPSFPIPKELPPGKTLRVAGSTSMSKINEALEKNFKSKYPGTDIKFSYQGTNAALKALEEEKIDLAAIGRPLTKEEKAQGLVAVPITRNKIAIIVGRNNRFQKSITAQQFAKIYRGEISDWAQVGGKPGKIRIVDRPESSDTRQAFTTYTIFQKDSFKPSSNHKKVSRDSTEAVIKQLGRDGIGYAISDQVVNNPRVRIVSMHNVLPNSPRYPFSQPLLYVYKKSNVSPTILAFLGNATSSQNQPLVEASRISGAIGAIDGSTTAAPTTKTPTAVAPPVAVAPDASSPAATEPNAGAGAVADDESTDKILPWLWLLLLLPLLGGLFWWLFKGRGGAAPEVVVPPVVPAPIPRSRLVLASRNNREAYAYWEVPDRVKEEMRQKGGQKMKLRLYDVTGIDMDHQKPHSVEEFNCSEQQQDLHLPIAHLDRDYIAELGYLTSDNGWLSVVRSNHLRISSDQLAEADWEIPEAAIAAAAAGVGLAGGLIPQETPATPIIPESRLILVQTSPQEAEASWEISPEKLAELRELGGKKLTLCLYDITGGIDLDLQPAHSEWQHECEEQKTHLQIPIPLSDRDYIAEIGYMTDYGQWLKIARSSPVRITSEVLDSQIPATIDGLGVAAAAAGIGLANGVMASETPATPVIEESRLILVQTSPQEAEASWEISPEKLAELRELGGKKLTLCLYDITGDIDLDLQSAHSEWQHECEEQKTHLQIPIPLSDRDYIAEIGYMTDYGQWLKIARSSPVRITSEVSDSQIPATIDGLGVAAAAAGIGLAGGVMAPETPPTPVIPESRLILVQTNPQEAEADWEISETQKAEIQQAGKILLLRVYDITGIDFDRQPANSFQEYECDLNSTNLRVAIPHSVPNGTLCDRDFVAEVGYITDEGQWLKLARSASLQIVSPPKEVSIQSIDTTILPAKIPSSFIGDAVPVISDELSNVTTLTPNVVGDVSETAIALTGDANTNSAAVNGDIAAVAGVATSATTTSQSSEDNNRANGQPASKSECRIILVPLNACDAYAYWEVSEDYKIALQQKGGERFMLRVHDATDLDIDYQQPHNTQEYFCKETQQDKHVIVRVSDRDYIAEVGYYTNDGQWLRLIRSFHVRIPLKGKSK
ncbi:DUF4912 domain-containing protein [Floridanema evergladense]|uniref:DUF4912 domain-containing protein n=1 Tax=Floridaenema evergladense BLCC-F167 TaxID=3153639 RepID=A0ABV4WVU2_9CYAN